VAHKPRHGKPGLAQKSWAWAAFFGPMSGPGQQNHGPTVNSGRAWVVFLGVFGKARPESPMARQKTPHSGRAWAEILGPTVGPGWAWATISCVGLFLGPTRPGPAREYAQVLARVFLGRPIGADNEIRLVALRMRPMVRFVKSTSTGGCKILFAARYGLA
jgi:hypothetical protein